MALIGKHEFIYRGKTYEFELSHNEERTTPGQAVYVLTARSLSEPNAEINVDLQVDWDRNTAQVSYDGVPVFQIAADAPMPDDVDTGWVEYVSRNFSDADPVSAIIDSIPAIDPILGCLLRGTLSATVSQLLRCWREVRQTANTIERARVLARCMGANFFRIAGTAMWRIGKCVVRHGF